MLITHEEARRLIQFDIDRVLHSDRKILLAAHLRECAECRTYAENLREVETVLSPLLKKQWNLQPLPLSITELKKNRNTKLQSSLLLVTRTALIGAVFLAFAFSAWQFVLSDPESRAQTPVGALLATTPLIQTTSTRARLEDCEFTRYTVQGNDTLASIARRFSTSSAEIMALNQMKTQTVNRSMQLLVPVCNSTPTSTVEGPTLFSTTFTPQLDQTTSTPGPGN